MSHNSKQKGEGGEWKSKQEKGSRFFYCKKGSRLQHQKADTLVATSPKTSSPEDLKRNAGLQERLSKYPMRPPKFSSASQNWSNVAGARKRMKRNPETKRRAAGETHPKTPERRLATPRLGQNRPRSFL
jgi:hypothetical protein